MKSKKLFAILTLVAFMMTLVPMAAFAADRYSSFYMTDKTSATADGEDKVKVTIYANSNNVPDAGAPIYVATYRYGADKLYADSSLTQALTESGAAAAKTFQVPNNGGKAEFWIASTVAGTTKIAAGFTAATAATENLYQYLVGLTNATKDSVNLIGEITDVTFTAGAGKTMTVAAVGDNVSGVSFSVSQSTATVYAISESSGTFAQANGTDYYEISYKLTSTGGAPVKDAEVQFSVSDPALSLNKTSAVSDQAGIVKVRVTSTKPVTSFSDSYQVKAKSGDGTAYAQVQFKATGAYRLELVSGGNETVARNQPYSIKFKVFDINGNQIKRTNTTGVDPVTAAVKDVIMFEATTKPTDAGLPEKISDGTTKVLVKGESSGNFILEIQSNTLDKDGDYVIKAYINNGSYVNVPFAVKKQGTINRMELSYDSTTVSKGGTTSGATIKYYDAENILKKVTSHSGVIFSVNPAPVAAQITQSTGEIRTTSATNDYKGKFIVTAVDNTENMAATYELTQTREVAYAKVESVTEAAPGSSATVAVQLYDIDGVKTAFGTSGTAPQLERKIVSSKPADSIVTVSASSDFVADMQKTGGSTITVKSTHAGTALVDCVIESNGTRYPFQAVVNFKEAPAPKEVIGAKNVTMFIGAPGYTQDGAPKVTDVAPFIKDGRTFVAVRPVADAFGAEIAWNEATQTVTLTRSDVTVTIVIGSDAITVVKDGVTSTVTADIAAFIKDGRTVLPFRAVGDAFGATVGYDAATQAVTYAQ